MTNDMMIAMESFLLEHEALESLDRLAMEAEEGEKKGFLVGAADAIGGAVKKIAGSIVNILKKVAETAVKVVKNLANLVKSGATKAVDLVKTAATKAVDLFKGALSKTCSLATTAINTVKGLFSKATSWAFGEKDADGSRSGGMVATVKEKIVDAKDKVLELLGKAKVVGAKMVGKGIDFAKDILGKLAGAIRKLADFVGSVIKRVLGGVQKLASSAWNAAKSAVSALGSMISGIFSFANKGGGVAPDETPVADETPDAAEDSWLYDLI